MSTFQPFRQPRILIVNVAFHELRGAVAQPRKIPHAMGPAYLAGAFDPHRCEIRLYNEVASGPLHHPVLLAWPDMLVLTGLTSGLDRMFHLTAYARTLNPRVIVVAGGPAIRALPEFTKPFFDYACQGDIEELRDVVEDAFGCGFSAQGEMNPRFDLAYWVGFTGHLESTRNCNFKCSFCSIAGEHRRYQKYPLESIRRQIQAAGRKKALLFIDQNFYGNDRQFFLERVALLREMRQAGRFQHWAALVTNDFFLKEENLVAARESGCIALFSGVESFDAGWLAGMNKLQNTVVDSTTMIRKCLEAGIVFLYGLMVDVTTRPVKELRAELEYVTGNSGITAPSFVTAPIPIPGTRYFADCLRRRNILPDTRLRDLDGATLALEPLDSHREAARFIADMQTMRGFRGRLLRHSAVFAWRYRQILTPFQLGIALSAGVLTALPQLATGSARSGVARTWLSSTEPLDPLYTPALPVARRFEHYFKPTMLTDSRGDLAPGVSELANRGAVTIPVSILTRKETVCTTVNTGN